MGQIYTYIYIYIYITYYVYKYRYCALPIAYCPLPICICLWAICLSQYVHAMGPGGPDPFPSPCARPLHVLGGRAAGGRKLKTDVFH